jgi:hypothetical protein
VGFLAETFIFAFFLGGSEAEAARALGERFMARPERVVSGWAGCWIFCSG